MFEAYRLRMGLSGNTSQEKEVNSTKSTIYQAFMKSVSCVKVLVDDEERHVIISEASESDGDTDKKEIVFPPDSSVSIGQIVKHNDKNFLITKVSVDVHNIYPEAEMKFCNASLPAGIIQEEVKVQVGTYFNGAPKYEVIQPAVYGEFPCIVESKVITSKTQEAINLPEGQLIVTLPFTEKFNLGESVVLYKESYKIIHIDWTNSYQDKGIIKLTVEREVGTSENT